MTKPIAIKKPRNLLARLKAVGIAIISITIPIKANNSFIQKFLLGLH